MSYSLVNK